MQVTWCNYKRTSINPVKIMKCLCQAKIILYVMIQLHETIPVTYFYIKDNMNEFKRHHLSRTDDSFTLPASWPRRLTFAQTIA